MLTDDRYMRRALELARLGLGRTSPNPPVGAVLVKDDRIVGEGWHTRAGEPHAEAVALAQAGDGAAGADLYCTLEPCCHHGRTPPCTDAIIAAGVRRVVFGELDPDPRCHGAGHKALVSAGLQVFGSPDKQFHELYEPYRKHKRTGLPFVTLKLAMTLDGKVASADGTSRWITDEGARRLVHHWRDQSDAVMVGVGTVLADDPQLTVRFENRDDRQPLRVIADTHAGTPVEARALCPLDDQCRRLAGQCLIAVGATAPQEAISRLQRAGAEVLSLPERDGRVDLAALMQILGERGVMSVLCEGGPTLAGSLVAAHLVDKCRLFYAPKFLGAGAVSAVNLSPTGLDDAPRLRVGRVQVIRNDILVTAYPCSRV